MEKEVALLVATKMWWACHPRLPFSTFPCELTSDPSARTILIKKISRNIACEHFLFNPWMSYYVAFCNIPKHPSTNEAFISILTFTTWYCAVCLAHLLFLLGMKGRWSAANAPQLCATIHLISLVLHTVIKSNLAAKYTSSYICMTRRNSLRWHPLAVQSHWGGLFGEFACGH